MENKKIGIIGAGAAGLIASAVSKTDLASVDVYEKNDKIGRKILASGNGRCNISNTNLSVDKYYGEDVSFAKHAIETFGFKEFDAFCKKIGLLLDIKEDGRVYPLSEESKSVVKIFEAYLTQIGVNLKTGTLVNKIEKNADKFMLFSDGSLLGEYDCVLLSAGSQASEYAGGALNGIDMAISLGHSVSAAYPSLVPLVLNSRLCRKMDGVKQKAEITLYIDKKKKKEIYGDVLFTKYGISGFAVLDISCDASFYLLNKRHVSISLNLLPKTEKQYIFSFIRRISQNYPLYTIFDVLCGILPKKIASTLLGGLNIDVQTKANSIETKQLKKLVNTMFDWRFEVASTRGFEYAEVSGGGVRTNEINNKTMESKIVKNLYFAGEILDITGKRGGYNLAFSFASGYLAGLSMKNNYFSSLE